MEKEFCSYEIALKLKELGFDEVSRFGNETSLYTKEGKHTFYSNYGFMYSGLSDGYIYAPLWQQVTDYFLSQYNIWIIVDTSIIKFYKNDELQPSKFQFVIEDLNNRDADYMFHSADEELFYFDYYDAREQAILKAIELI